MGGGSDGAGRALLTLALFTRGCSVAWKPDESLILPWGDPPIRYDDPPARPFTEPELDEAYRAIAEANFSSLLLLSGHTNRTADEQAMQLRLAAAHGSSPAPALQPVLQSPTGQAYSRRW